MTNTNPQYAVVDAPGCCGDYATVWATDDSLERAQRKAKNMRRVVVIEGHFAKGDKVHRADYGFGHAIHPVR